MGVTLPPGENIPQTRMYPMEGLEYYEPQPYRHQRMTLKSPVKTASPMVPILLSYQLLQLPFDQGNFKPE